MKRRGTHFHVQAAAEWARLGRRADVLGAPGERSQALGERLGPDAERLARSHLQELVPGPRAGLVQQPAEQSGHCGLARAAPSSLLLAVVVVVLLLMLLLLLFLLLMLIEGGGRHGKRRSERGDAVRGELGRDDVRQTHAPTSPTHFSHLPTHFSHPSTRARTHAHPNAQYIAQQSNARTHA